jgi:transglutaminase-like putative cysteine protease
VVLLCFFMQLGQFLYQQNMAVAALAFIGAITTVASLLALQGFAEPPRARALAAARLILQGLPLMLVLFVLFPRVQGPLWGLPADAYNGLEAFRTAWRRAISPVLGESGAIAFRARFEGDPPPPAERYWRGPVLTRFDGHTWRTNPLAVCEQPAYRPQGIAYPYTLTLEAHNNHWLLALDFPAATPGLRFTDDYQLLAREPVHNRQRVTLLSYPHTPVGVDETAVNLRAALALPPGFNPRTRELGQRLRAEAKNPADIPALAIAHFRQSRLNYTLEPCLSAATTWIASCSTQNRAFASTSPQPSLLRYAPPASRPGS